MSMAAGTEARVPFLDHTLVEFMFSISPMIKMPGGQLKYLLRQAVKGHIPESVRRRTDKMGFPVPINKWFKEDCREFILDILRSKKIH